MNGWLFGMTHLSGIQGSLAAAGDGESPPRGPFRTIAELNSVLLTPVAAIAAGVVRALLGA
jgi:hypothetical protein